MKHRVAILILTMGILVKCASDSRMKNQNNTDDYQANKKTFDSREDKDKIALMNSESSYKLSHPDSGESLNSDYVSPKSDRPRSLQDTKNKGFSRSHDYDDVDYRKADEASDYDSTMPKDYDDSKESQTHENSYSDSKNIKESYPTKSYYSEPLHEPHHKTTKRSYHDSEESNNSYHPTNRMRTTSYPNDSSESSGTYHHAGERRPILPLHPTSRQSNSYYPNDVKPLKTADHSSERKGANSKYYTTDEKMYTHPESSQSNNSGQPVRFYNQNDYENIQKSHSSESGRSTNSYQPDYSTKSSDARHSKTSANSYHPKNNGKADSDYHVPGEDYDERFGFHSPKSEKSTEPFFNKGRFSKDENEPLVKNDNRKYIHDDRVYQYYDEPSSGDNGKSNEYHTSQIKKPVSSEENDQTLPPPKSPPEAVTITSAKTDHEAPKKEEQEEKAHKGEESMKLQTKAKRHYGDYYHPYKTTTPPPAIPGVAGVDYPILAAAPATGFNCSRHKLAGYYADPVAQCQVFYICQADGRQDAFLCPNGTIFNQQYLVCDWWYNVNCAKSADYYKVNSKLYVAAASKTVNSNDKKKDHKSNDDGKEKRSSGPITRIQAVGYGKNDKSVNSYAYQEVTEGVGTNNDYVYDY